MKSLFLATIMALLPMTTLAQNASSAKVAELAAHRVDRLVTTGKIDAGFAKRLERIDVSAASPAPAAFKVLVSQTKPLQGLPIQVEMVFDVAGKPLSFKAIPGGVAGADPGYDGGKNAVTLFENSLHQIIDSANDANIAPFANGLTSVILTKVNQDGMIMSKAQVKSSATPSKLNVYLMLNGAFMSKDIEK
ncbi:MAG: hypothetical protein V4736_10785 [Bdellovibrionota bacterium]